jgi:hypothetical protein
VSVSSSIDPVVDQFADVALWEAKLVGDPVEAESSLVARMGQVPDRRGERVGGICWRRCWCPRRARRWRWVVTR